LITLLCIPGFSGVTNIGHHNGPAPGIKSDYLLDTEGQATIDDDKESDDSLESGNDSDNDVLDVFMNLLTIINNDHIPD
jgi:hypothetical protein